jgi:signal transduction histidine kinase
MTVPTQLALGFGAVVAVTLVTGGVSALALRSTVEQKDEVARSFAEELSLVERLRYRAEQLVSTSRGYLLTGHPQYRENFATAKMAFRESFRDLKVHALANEAEFLQRIERSGEHYATAAERAAERRGELQYPGPLVPYFDDVVKPARDLLEAHLDEFVRRKRSAFADEFARSRQSALHAQITIGATTALGLLLSVWLAFAVRRRLTEQFRRERESADMARRAAVAREEVLAVVSHDLQNPLGAILMSSSLVQRRLPPQAETVRPQVDAIHRAARQMQHLIGDLLDAASIEAGKLELSRERCDMGRLVSDALELFEARAVQAGVRLMQQLPPISIIGWLDRVRVMQVLSNLVGNALNFTSAGGEVKIRVDHDNDSVRFSVRDTGTGIPAPQIPRLFERHWQSQRGRRGGLGLGLYIARNIVTAHGGTIDVSSKVGEGSTFTFTIPIRPARAETRPVTRGELSPEARWVH